LSTTKQSSKDYHAQQQISNAERDFEQQIQQQTNLPGIAGLAKMFIKK